MLMRSVSILKLMLVIKVNLVILKTLEKKMEEMKLLVVMIIKEMVMAIHFLTMTAMGKVTKTETGNETKTEMDMAMEIETEMEMMMEMAMIMTMVVEMMMLVVTMVMAMTKAMAVVMIM